MDNTITQKIKPVIVATKNLTKTYLMGKGLEVQALNNVSLEVTQGEFLAVIGPSGSGKSTLLNVIGCLDKPTSGQIFLDGEEVKGFSSGRMALIRQKMVGFVFQQFNLIPTLTALENVMLPLKYAGVRKKEQRKVALEALERVGLLARARHRPGELSGGEQQRVAVARALINKPRLILADEPTGELDSHTSEELVAMLKELNKGAGQTFIMVTHNLDVAKEAHRIVQMKDGEIVEQQ